MNNECPLKCVESVSTDIEIKVGLLMGSILTEKTLYTYRVKLTGCAISQVFRKNLSKSCLHLNATFKIYFHTQCEVL